MNRLQPWKVLWLCSGNSARSLIAERLLRAKSKGRFAAFSAGLKSLGRINPPATRVLRDRDDLDATDLRSKSWGEFRGERFDFIITVCDLASDACRSRPEARAAVHWGSPDPTEAEGSEETRYRRFVEFASQVSRRIDLMCAFSNDQLLPWTMQGIGEEFALQSAPRFALAI